MNAGVVTRGGTLDKTVRIHEHRGLNISYNSLNISGGSKSCHKVRFVLL